MHADDDCPYRFKTIRRKDAYLFLADGNSAPGNPSKTEKSLKNGRRLQQYFDLRAERFRREGIRNGYYPWNDTTHRAIPDEADLAPNTEFIVAILKKGQPQRPLWKTRDTLPLGSCEGKPPKAGAGDVIAGRRFLWHLPNTPCELKAESSLGLPLGILLPHLCGLDQRKYVELGGLSGAEITKNFKKKGGPSMGDRLYAATFHYLKANKPDFFVSLPVKKNKARFLAGTRSCPDVQQLEVMRELLLNPAVVKGSCTALPTTACDTTNGRIDWRALSASSINPNHILLLQEDPIPADDTQALAAARQWLEKSHDPDYLDSLAGIQFQRIIGVPVTLADGSQKLLVSAVNPRGLCLFAGSFTTKEMLPLHGRDAQALGLDQPLANTTLTMDIVPPLPKVLSR